MKRIRPDVVALVLVHLHRDVHDLALGVGPALGADRPLEVALGAVDVAQLVVGLREARLAVDVARLRLEQGAQASSLKTVRPSKRTSPSRYRSPSARDLQQRPLHRLLPEETRPPVHVGDLRLADRGGDVAAVEVEVLQPRLVALARVVPALGHVRPLAPAQRRGEEAPGARAAPALDLLHAPAQGPRRRTPRCRRSPRA